MLALFSLLFSANIVLADSPIFAGVPLNACRQAALNLGELEDRIITENAQKGYVQKGNTFGILQRNAERMFAAGPEQGFLAVYYQDNETGEKVGYLAPGFYGKTYHCHFALPGRLMNKKTFSDGLKRTMAAIPDGGVPDKDEVFLLSLAPSDPANELAKQYGFIGEKKMLPLAEGEGEEQAKPYRDDTSMKWIDTHAQELGEDLARRLRESSACERIIYKISLDTLKAKLAS